MSNAVGMRLYGVDNIQNKLRQLENNTRRNLERRVELTTAQAEQSAKNDAPWTDRTGNARRSINGSTITTRDMITAYLSIGVYYGKYLELSNVGKYRIIEPTVQQYRPKYLRNLNGILQA